MEYATLEEKDYLELTDGAKLVKRTRTKIRLLLSPDNKIIKHIYRRKLLSSTTLWPHAAQFIKNAKKLSSMDIFVPNIHAVYYYPKLNCDIILYDYVEGITLYEMASNNDLSFLPKLAEYIAELHQLGIYFKDLHLNNIVLNNGVFTLLDLESIHCKRRPLRSKQRAKNLAYLFNIKEHIEFYLQFGGEKFLQEYFKLSTLSERSQRKIMKYLKPKIPANHTH
jgi:predicted Ser/Thr protein kinase